MSRLTKHDAMNDPGMRVWSNGSGRIELVLLPEDAEIGYHSGMCDDDIAYLRTLPYIAEQLAELDKHTVADEVAQWSDWDVSDHDENLNRLLWIACGDVVEMDFMEAAHG